jgi:hypothetical protein
MTARANPFFFETPSDRWAFTDREALLPALQDLLGQRARRLLLHGRRRMGKTSLVQHAATRAGGVFLYADLSTAASLAEAAKKLLDAAPEESGRFFKRAVDLAKKHFSSVNVSAGKVTLSGDFRSENGERTFEQVLNYLNERAGIDDAPWTICFDEFQDIRAIGGDRADWRIRGIISGHRHLNYIFSGSDHRLLEWMTEPAAAFFKQLQQMEVGPIPPEHLARWIEKRARIGGLADFPFGTAIVQLAGPCTGDIVRLAKVVFDVVAGGTRPDQAVATAFDAIALGELASENLARWENCSVAQRAMLRALAAGKAPTAADTLREFGIRTASTAQSAVERLIAMQAIVRDRSGLAFDNPYFKRWVAYHAA